MKYLAFTLLISLFALSCGNSSESDSDSSKNSTTEKVDSVVEKNVSKIENKFILDELLKINSEKELKNQFGAENVTRREEWFAEGTVSFMQSVLHADSPKEVVFQWEDDSVKFEKLSSVTVYMKNAPWKAANGLHVGMRMTELETMNGKPFTFFGFGWDYAGGCNFEGGKLFNTIYGITLGEVAENEYENPAYMKLLGDAEFKSDSKEALAYNPAVVELRLRKE